MLVSSYYNHNNRLCQSFKKKKKKKNINSALNGNQGRTVLKINGSHGFVRFVFSVCNNKHYPFSLTKLLFF